MSAPSSSPQSSASSTVSSPSLSSATNSAKAGMLHDELTTRLQNIYRTDRRCCSGHLGTTSIGQPFALFLRKRRLSAKYTICLVTADERSVPRITTPLRISGAVTFAEGASLLSSLADRLTKKPLFSLALQPRKILIPSSRASVSLQRLPEDVHLPNKIDQYLQKGDEVFTLCATGGVSFFHSGIYAGDGLVYHFINDAGATSLTTFIKMFHSVPGRVCLESWQEYTHALIGDDDAHPVVFRVAYALRVRDGAAIVEWAEVIKNSKQFAEYDIRRRNCQHFSSMCSTGAAFSYDLSSGVKAFACTLLRGAVSGSMSISSSSSSSLAASQRHHEETPFGPSSYERRATVAIAQRTRKEHRAERARSASVAVAEDVARF